MGPYQFVVGLAAVAIFAVKKFVGTSTSYTNSSCSTGTAYTSRTLQVILNLQRQYVFPLKMFLDIIGRYIFSGSV